jgi:hypothetical protein
MDGINGQEQSMVYGDCDAGLSFHLSVDDRQAIRHDLTEAISLDKQNQVKLNTSELVDLLMVTDLGLGLGRQALLSTRVVDFQNEAMTLPIDVNTVLTTKHVKGRVDERKGPIQVLWERGFIDESKLKSYRTKVLDGDGNIVPELLSCPCILAFLYI